MTSNKLLAKQYLEMISLMAKTFVQTEWPDLIPVRFLLI